MDKQERVIAYVDGFNLYFGVKQNSWNDLLWLDVNGLAKKLLMPNQQLITTKYFTSRVRNHPDKEKRQKTYLEALQHFTKVEIFYGHYQSHIETCRRCGHSYPYANEKMTDVNIATEMMMDAFEDNYDAALLITGDSDLVPPVKRIHQHFKNKRVIVGFPPNRNSVNLKSVAKGSFVIGRKSLKENQMPDKIVTASGFILERPNTWH